MQLSTLVLPAPFGPINAKSSPRSTVKDPSSSTTRPPNRKLRWLTVSSAIPSLRAAVLLEVTKGPTLSTRMNEIELLNVLRIATTRQNACKHDTAVLHHVSI